MSLENKHTDLPFTSLDIKKRLGLYSNFVTFSGLILIFDNILALKLSHALNFVQVYHEALVVAMERFYTLTAKDGLVVGAVEVFNALWMLITQLLAQTFLVLIFEVKVGGCQDWVFLNDLIENVDIEGESFC